MKKYFYDQSISISIENIRRFFSELKNISAEDLKWIANNRDHAEKERYRVKDEFNASIVAAKETLDEREKIEKIFANNTLTEAIDEYLKLLSKRLLELNTQYDLFRKVDYSNTDELIKQWASVIAISNIDNAHAMYLSSNNWDFSVFNAVLIELRSVISDDEDFLAILSLGVQDIRTRIFSTLPKEYKCTSEDDFFVKVLKNHDFITDDGICPFLLYHTCKVQYTPTRITPIEPIIERLIKGKTHTEIQRFYDILDNYARLFYARLAYDTYEYYGYYAFIRHFAIRKTFETIKDSIVAERFKHFSSTYQFDRAIQILTGGK